MITRITLVVGLLIWGGTTGGWAGLATAFLLCGLLGFWLGPPPQATGSPLSPSQGQIDPDPVQARRGRRIGSETTDDYMGMITTYIERHRDPTRP
jgi:hypothetical protein